ncbi:MAG: hypothetical protein IPK16_03245 [Anaerolineales bacterium]|nr:hypothetical protein [Anaerolineales bacterium]
MILLIASEFYIRLSGAVMVGFPAVALAMVSVALLLAAKQRWWMLALSGLVMALALRPS